MNISSLARYAIGVSTAAAFLAACSGNGSQSTGMTPTGTAPQSVAKSAGHHHFVADIKKFGLTNAGHFVPVHHEKHGKSFMGKDAGKQWLLYASDTTYGTIDIYNYRARANPHMFGQITGWTYPYGQCLDSAGDVYVVDFSTGAVAEYAHGGTSPIATASVSGALIGCGVNPTNGDVAVSSFYGTGGSGEGGVTVFHGGLTGSSSFYTDYPSGSETYYYWPPGYDASGNLYVEGLSFLTGTYDLLELPSGSGTFTTLSGITIHFAGAVQWDGSYVSATDQEANSTFNVSQTQFTASGSTATPVRTSVFTDDCYVVSGVTYSYVDWVQAALNGTTRKMNGLAAGNLDCASRLGRWNYANGGNPTYAWPSSVVPATPYGQVVSPPTSGS